jgi:hypothetical protein
MDYLKQKLYLIQFRVGHGSKFAHFKPSYDVALGCDFSIKYSPVVEADANVLIEVEEVLDAHYSVADEPYTDTYVEATPTFEPRADDTEHPMTDTSISVTPVFELIDRFVAYVVLNPIISVVPTFIPYVTTAFNVIASEKMAVKPSVNAGSCYARGTEISKNVTVDTNIVFDGSKAIEIEGNPSITFGAECEAHSSTGESKNLAYDGNINVGNVVEAEAMALEVAPIDIEKYINAGSSAVAILKSAESIEAEKNVNVVYMCATTLSTEPYEADIARNVSLDTACIATLTAFTYADIDTSITFGAECEATLAYEQYFAGIDETIALGTSCSADMITGDSAYAEIDSTIKTDMETTAIINDKPTHTSILSMIEMMAGSLVMNMVKPTDTDVQLEVTSASELELTIFGQRKLDDLKSLTLDAMTSSTLSSLQYGSLQ